MRPSIRLLSTVVEASRRPRLGLLDVASTRWRVLPGDLDLFGHMNNSRYLAVMDLARVDLLVRLGVSTQLLRRRWVLPVGAASVEFHDSLNLFEPYEIRTRIEGWDDHWFYLRQEFVRPQRPARLVGTGLVKTLVRGPEGLVAPKDVVALLGVRAGASPSLPAAVRQRFGLGNSDAAPNTPHMVAREPIAIVGIGCRLPGGGSDPAALWDLLREGRDCITDIPAGRWSPKRFYDPTGNSPGRSYVQRGGLLAEDIFAFDAGFFGITPREAETLDPQQRLLLQASWEALEDAGISPDSLAGTSTGVFVGGFTFDAFLLLSSPANREHLSNHSATSASLTMLSNRLSYTYDLRGPSVSIDTACSSSLVGLHFACQSMWSGEITAALVGGASALLSPETHVMMSKGRFLSPRGRCHAFSANADGYVRAEGAAVLALKPLSAARRDGNPVYATILGTACNQDGRTNGITVPNGEAQVAVMRRAYAAAGVDSAQVTYVEAHGTGTAAGDPIEARAIGAVVGAGRRHEPCIIGSIKSNMGHLEAASGVAGVVKVALCLKHRQIVPNLHSLPPSPAIPLEELGLKVAGRNEPMAPRDGRLIAGINSFGYGGTNAHVVLSAADEVPGAEEAAPSDRLAILPISARSPEALAALASRYSDLLAGPESLWDVARSAAVHRSHHRYRLAWHGATREDASASLKEGSQGNALGLARSGVRLERGRVLFVYSGMGPHWWGMGRELMAREPVYRDAVEECDALWRGIAGFSIAEELARAETSSNMSRTDIAQPAGAVLQIALTRLWAAYGVDADGFVGHSVGEVVSAHAAGVLGLAEALRVVYHRSRLQRRLAGRGVMLAVGLSPTDAEAQKDLFGPDVSIAALNSPSSVTLAGTRPALEAVARRLEAEGIFQRFLQVEVPYHSPVMDEIGAELQSSLAGLVLDRSRLPLYSTVTGRLASPGSYDAAYWFQNVRAPVRFADAIGAALDDGFDAFVEIGPHPVLATALKDVTRDRRAESVVVASSLRRAKPERAALVENLAHLYAAGVEVAWERYFGAGRYRPIPKYPWQTKSTWSEVARSASHRYGDAAHPLLTEVSDEPHRVATAELNLSRQPYLLDHVVGGTPLFPGAGFIELLFSARQALTGSPLASLEEIEFRAPLVLTEESLIRLVVSTTEASSAHIHARTGDAPQVLCAVAKIFSLGATKGSLDEAAVAARLPEVIGPAELYAKLARVGLSYGPRFRAATEVRFGAGEVLARLSLPDGVEHEGYFLHPVLCDAALHTLLAAAVSQVGMGTIVPESIERVQLFGSAGRHASAWGRLTKVGHGQVRGDVVLYDERGQAVAEMRGICCRVLTEPTSARQSRIGGWGAVPVYRPIETRVSGAAPSPVACLELGPGASSPASGLTGQPPRRIVDRRWLARSGDDDPVGRGIAAAAALLATVNALPRGTVERYFVVTSGAAAVGPQELPALGLAPLCGLARTVMTERPDLKMTLVDVDDVATPVEALLADLGEEQEVALRDGRLFAWRLVPRALSEAAPPAPRPARKDDAYALRLAGAGNLDSLLFESTTRRAPGTGEVEIAIELAPLGFKDVMKTLGALSPRVLRDTYFGDTVGMEAVGRVSAIGAGVTSLSPGQRVYVAAPGCLRSHVVTPASYVLPLPDLIPDGHVTNMIGFMTAWCALIDAARLQRGERVLIHGATGGVGLAAIEVARHLGAEIIASAGSEDKRRFLGDLGIAHVTDSRDVRFADDVRAWTNGRGVDVVLSFSSGELMAKSVACLAPFGRFIEIGKMSIEKDAPLHLRPFNDNLSYTALDFDRALRSRPQHVMDAFREVLARLITGDLHPTPLTIFPASQVVEAFRLMARGKHIGKVAVGIQDERVEVTPSVSSRFAEGATYLVSGGLRGFGLEVARWLASEGARHLVLLGRTGATTPETRDALQVLREGGVVVETAAVDVADQGALAALLDDVQSRLPPLRGVFHAAAAYDDRPLETIDRRSLERVFQPKAGGAWNLHVLTRDMALDHFVLFSSVSSLIGNAGQGSYVAANHFMDQLAALRRSQGLPALSINWGALSETGQVARDERLGKHLALRGIRGIMTSDALLALGRVLDGDPDSPPQWAVVDADWGRVVAGLGPWGGRERLRELAVVAGGDPSHERARHWLSMGPEQALAALVERLRGIVGKVLRVGPGDLDPAIPLRDLGMDSLLAMEITVAVEGELHMELPSLFIGAGPPLRDLAKALFARLSQTSDTQRQPMREPVADAIEVAEAP